MRAAFGLGGCLLFPQCVQAVIPLVGGVPVGVRPACSSREMEAMGRAYSQCLVAEPLTEARTHGPWGCRLLQLAGPWAVAVTLRNVKVASRVFGSGNGNGRMCVFPGNEGNGWYSAAMPSSVATPRTLDFCFVLGLYPGHMEYLSVGGELDLLLPVYTGATAMPDP